jgi:hypothetical protein
LLRLEDLAQRARKAESAGFQLSNPTSPVPPSSHSASMRSYRASQLPQPPPSATRKSQRSPLPPAPVNAEYYDENGANIRVYGGNGTINLGQGHRDPFADGQSISTTGSSNSTNIIPIQYIPSTSEEGVSQAARKLDEARQNLFKPRHAPPRPARSPDLDLRLNPPHDSRSPVASEYAPGRIRDSYLSENSAAPSFLSGNSYDVYNDAPKIVTSKQIHVGRLQQAEVVQFGRAGDSSQQHLTTPQHLGLSSPATFGTRSLTPTSVKEFDDEMEGINSAEPTSAGSGDLRFSMGSLAYRDSVSTMGTGRYLAQPAPSAVAPPRSGERGNGPRESVLSSKSYADSVLSAFPMIPPGQGGVPHLPASNLPQSTSVSTLDHAAMGMPLSKPPPAFRYPQQSRPPPQSRPVTAMSVADSFLGTFPFVPPNMDDMAGLPSAALPSAAVPDTAKRGTGPLGRGVSTTSEGLGGFDFTIEERKKSVG